MLIVFTGIDGSGKSTQTKLLANYFSSINKKFIVSKAYNSEEKNLFEKYIEKINPLALTFLFQCFLVQQVIETEKALNEGKIVIADRWNESNIAYHSYIQLFSSHPNLIHSIDNLIFKEIKPNICFFLKMDPQLAFERTIKRGQNYLDSLGIKYFQSMEKSFSKQSKENNWQELDATLSEEEIHSQIIQILSVKYFN